MFLLLSNRAQQSQLEFSFAPDKAPATVPTEMFSNDMESKFNTIVHSLHILNAETNIFFRFQ